MINKTGPHFLLLFLFISLMSASCSHLSKEALNQKNKKAVKKHVPVENRYADFDHKVLPNKVSLIEHMIHVVQPELETNKRTEIAQQISRAIAVHKVEPQIIVAIIDTESNFKSDKISSTGDLSVGQINLEVWNKEFARMNLKTMPENKIKKDQQFALYKMAEILSIIKKRYAKTDRRWYARYHSNTKVYKLEYLQKLELRLKMIALSLEKKKILASL